MNVNSSMELSDFHHNKMLILNRLPIYELSVANSTSEKLIPSGRQFSNEIPIRQPTVGCRQTTAENKHFDRDLPFDQSATFY